MAREAPRRRRRGVEPKTAQPHPRQAVSRIRPDRFRSRRARPAAKRLRVRSRARPMPQKKTFEQSREDIAKLDTFV